MGKHGPCDRVEYNGRSFCRYPESPRAELRNYYYNSSLRKRLHQVVWEHHNGPIPEGHHVHHKDENTLNNAPANLECLPGAAHLARHMDAERRTGLRENIKKAIAAAPAWHRSDAGREWHKQHGRDVWADRKPVDRVCEQCGNKYETLSRDEGNRFCGNNCKSAWRRAARLDHVERNCAHCGGTFTASKYAKTITCSRVCGGLYRRGKPRARSVRSDSRRTA
jgi:hypothetical protein